MNLKQKVWARDKTVEIISVITVDYHTKADEIQSSIHFHTENIVLIP